MSLKKNGEEMKAGSGLYKDNGYQEKRVINIF